MNYDELLAPAAKAMRPSGIRKFFDLAADMPHCISLGVGEPDFKTPWSVRDAGIRSLELGRTKYTANAGLKDLRKEICTYLQRRFELHYQEENVLVTVGGSEAIDLAIRALVQPGDEVIIPEPCFVCYEPITQLTGGVPVHIATRAEDQFRLTADQLRAAITPKTKLLIFPYPNNPTGAVMSAAEVEEIAAVLRETNVLVLSDAKLHSVSRRTLVCPITSNKTTIITVTTRMPTMSTTTMTVMTLITIICTRTIIMITPHRYRHISVRDMNKSVAGSMTPLYPQRPRNTPSPFWSIWDTPKPTFTAWR